MQRYPQPKSSKKWRQLLWLVPVILIALFCFNNSLQPVTESRDFTLKILRHLNQLSLQYLGRETPLTNHSLRKLGHLGEFMGLGFFLYLALQYLFVQIRKKKTVALILAFLAAACDETIQLFALNRGAQFRDVLLDTTGAFLGIMLAYLLVKLISKLFSSHSPKWH